MKISINRHPWQLLRGWKTSHRCIRSSHETPIIVHTQSQNILKLRSKIRRRSKGISIQQQQKKIKKKTTKSAVAPHAEQNIDAITNLHISTRSIASDLETNRSWWPCIVFFIVFVWAVHRFANDENDNFPYRLVHAVHMCSSHKL